MAWKPKFWGNKPSSAKSEAAALDDDDTDELDDVETPDDDDEEEAEAKDEPAAAAKETPATDAPAADAAAISAENAKLKAENEKLRARAGEKTLEQCQRGALASAVRLFGQKSPLLAEAKKQVKLCSTPDEADAFRAAWDLAMSTTPLSRLAGRMQTTGASAGGKVTDEYSARLDEVRADEQKRLDAERQKTGQGKRIAGRAAVSEGKN